MNTNLDDEPRPTTGGKFVSTASFTGVSEMVRNTCDDPAFADAFDEILATTRVSRSLAVGRATARMTQGEVARAMGCSQGKVSKIEASDDRDLSFGDIVDFAKAIGHTVNVSINRPTTGPIDEIQARVKSIRLVVSEVAGRSAEGLERYVFETIGRYLDLTLADLGRLPDPGRQQEVTMLVQTANPPAEKVRRRVRKTAKEKAGS